MWQVALLGEGRRGSSQLEEKQRLSWEARRQSSLALAARGSAGLRALLAGGSNARLTSLSLMSDIEEIPVKGTKYESYYGCDRAAGGCSDKLKMWVPKGAKYARATSPDAQVSVEMDRALEGVQDPVLTDLDNPPAAHTEEVAAITASTESSVEAAAVDPGPVLANLDNGPPADHAAEVAAIDSSTESSVEAAAVDPGPVLANLDNGPPADHAAEVAAIDSSTESSVEAAAVDPGPVLANLDNGPPADHAAEVAAIVAPSAEDECAGLSNAAWLECEMTKQMEGEYGY